MPCLPSAPRTPQPRATVAAISCIAYPVAVSSKLRELPGNALGVPPRRQLHLCCVPRQLLILAEHLQVLMVRCQRCCWCGAGMEQVPSSRVAPAAALAGSVAWRLCRSPLAQGRRLHRHRMAPAGYHPAGCRQTYRSSPRAVVRALAAALTNSRRNDSCFLQPKGGNTQRRGDGARGPPTRSSVDSVGST